MRVLALLFLSGVAAGASREVAITIDDLPRGGDGGVRTFAGIRGMTERLLEPLRVQKIPLTGFVHPGRTELTALDLRRILDLWLDAGAQLGNHTWSHADLNRVPVAEYEQDILKAEAALLPAVNGRVTARHTLASHALRHIVPIGIPDGAAMRTARI
jgi:peptidoglycan/xylan/chitin deacetylase (PgdA/CDA1 family)